MLRITIHLVVQQRASVQAHTLLRLPVEDDAVAYAAQHDRTAVGNQGDRSAPIQGKFRPRRDRTRIVYRHAAGCQGNVLRRRVQALIRLALERYSEAPETPSTEDFAEIDLVDDPGVIGAVRLVAERTLYITIFLGLRLPTHRKQRSSRLHRLSLMPAHYTRIAPSPTCTTK